MSLLLRNMMGLMKNIEQDATDFIPITVGDEHGVMPVSKVRALAQQTSRKLIGGIHRFDVAGKIGAACISDSSGVDQIEMVEWHRLLPDRCSGS
jgi:hypothetical protein